MIIIASGAALRARRLRRSRPNTIAVAGSTLIAATLFQPLRRRVQTVVDRRFNRTRYDAARIAAAFGDRLRDQVDLSALRSDFETTVGASVRPTSVGLWVRRRG